MFRVIVLALALLVGGCGIVHQELNNRGGYVDYLADKYWWKADSKKMRALRAYALHTAIARIAMISPKSAQSRDNIALQIGAASSHTKKLFDCAFSSPEPCFYFDSIMVDYVAALYDAAIAALPLDDARKLINDITGGIFGPVAAVDALRALIELGSNAVRYGAVSAALYRDSLELEVLVWINSPDQPGSRVRPADVETLSLIYYSGTDNIPAWKTEIERLVQLGLEPTPSPVYFVQLRKLMTYACRQITQAKTVQDLCIGDLDLNAILVSRGTGGGTTGSRPETIPQRTDPAVETPTTRFTTVVQRIVGSVQALKRFGATDKRAICTFEHISSLATNGKDLLESRTPATFQPRVCEAMLSQEARRNFNSIVSTLAILAGELQKENQFYRDAAGQNRTNSETKLLRSLESITRVADEGKRG